MTLAESYSIPSSRRRRGNSHLPTKPQSEDDLNDLRDLAHQLDGQPMPGVRMSEAQFEKWSDGDIRAEWIDGEVILLSPANIPHVDLNLWLAGLIREVVDAEECGRVLGVETQVRLQAVKQRRNPDVVFVSHLRQQIIKQTYIDGPPDLVMEIVSPDSVVRDWREKFNAYEKSGVREYWVIDPVNKRVEVYTLGKNGKYTLLKESDGRITSKVIRKLSIRPNWLWESPLPKIAKVLKEIGVR